LLKKDKANRVALIEEGLALEEKIKPYADRLKEVKAILKDDLKGNNLDSAEGKTAVAVLIKKKKYIVDGPAYWDLVDGDPDKILSVVNFRLDPKDGKMGIRSFIGDEDLKAISSIEEEVALSIKPKSKSKEVPVPLSQKIVVGEPPSMVRRIPGRRTATKS